MTTHPILFVPGLMCDHRLWQPQVECFECERTVAVADVSRDASIEAMASRALTAVAGDFILAGLSMGGIIAFEMVRQAPERIKGLALLDTNAMAESDARKKERTRQIAEARKGQLSRIVIEELKPNYLAPAHRQDRQLKEKILAMAQDQGIAVFEQQSRALMGRRESVETLSKIQCPTEVLCGQEDELCPVEYHQMMASHIPGAHLTVLPDCGHMSSLEAPIVVNKMLKDLIKRVEGE